MAQHSFQETVQSVHLKRPHTIHHRSSSAHKLQNSRKTTIHPPCQPCNHKSQSLKTENHYMKRDFWTKKRT